MGRRIVVPIHVDIPYGQERQITFYINDILYENVEDYKVTKYLNSIYTITGMLYGADKTDTNVAVDKTIKVFAGNTCIMVGTLDKPTWKSHDEVVINAICIISSKLKAARVGNNIENESYFDNKTSTYITNRMCSVNTDGSAPWIVTANNIDDFAKIFIRGDNETKLGIIMSMAKDMNYNWYPSYGVSPYDSTILNIEQHKGSQSSVMTLITSGTSQNVELSSREENRDELWNDVLVCGYGDGINQIKSRCLSSSVNKTALTSDITATATTATVDDGSKLSGPGTVVIGCEKIPYTITGNTLTLTRGSATFLTGTNVTETYAHNAGIVVYDYNAPTSPEANSSMDTYGHKASPPQTDRSIMDQNTLDRVAQIILDEHDEELVRIEVIAMDMYDILDTVTIGDYVTVTEPAVGNDGDYRIVGFEIEEDQLKIICSNVPRIISETIASVEEQEKNLNYYMQGTSSIISIQSYENAQQSTIPEDKASKMKFRVWDKTIAIRDARLDFKVLPFRGYDTTSASTTTTDGTVSATATFYASAMPYIYRNLLKSSGTIYTQSGGLLPVGINGSGNVTSYYNAQHYLASNTAWAYHDSWTWNTPHWAVVKCPNVNTGSFKRTRVRCNIRNGYSATRTFYWEIRLGNATTGTILNSGNVTLSGQASTDFEGLNTTTDYNGQKIYMVITAPNFNVTTNPDLSHFTMIVTTYANQTHNHDPVYGIEEDSDTPTVKIQIGNDDDWTATKAYINSGSAYTYNTHNNIDITTALRTVVGNLSSTKRIRIQFEPQGTGNTCRIEANVDVFTFLGSV